MLKKRIIIALLVLSVCIIASSVNPTVTLQSGGINWGYNISTDNITFIMLP
jgi:hypothetical protein